MSQPERHPGRALDGAVEVPRPQPVVYYALQDRQTCVYVGSSRNLVQRLATHAQTAPWWALVWEVEWLAFDTIEEARAFERNEIYRLDPIGNIDGRPLRGPVLSRFGR